jgi:hypothetical protein
VAVTGIEPQPGPSLPEVYILNPPGRLKKSILISELTSVESDQLDRLIMQSELGPAPPFPPVCHGMRAASAAAPYP